MALPTCASCTAFLLDPRGNLNLGGKPGPVTTGWCRANPPQLVVVPGEHLPGLPASMKVQGMWPPVDDTQWCRQHEARE